MRCYSYSKASIYAAAAGFTAIGPSSGGFSFRPSLLHHQGNMQANTKILTKSDSPHSPIISFSSSLKMSQLGGDGPPAVLRGCGAVPYQKKKVAVFGAGGYLGAVVFGFLQRAASLYGTGVGDGASGSSIPRCITATATGSMALNRVLSKNFKLAYAGENMMALTDMTCVSRMTSALDSMDAVVLGTHYQLETRAVTGNTYETSPNDKTQELYLDECRAADDNVMEEDYHIELFKRTIEACAAAGVKHVVVIETPQTQSDQDQYCQVLEESGVPFTYIQTKGSWTNAKDYTFEKGLGQRFILKSAPITSTGGNSPSALQGLLIQQEVKEDASATVFREDIAALAVQCLISLDWTASRYIVAESISTTDAGNSNSVDNTGRRKLLLKKSDKIWCRNSESIAKLLEKVK
jgi:hypothetical protein